MHISGPSEARTFRAFSEGLKEVGKIVHKCCSSYLIKLRGDSVRSWGFTTLWLVYGLQGLIVLKCHGPTAEIVGR